MPFDLHGFVHGFLVDGVLEAEGFGCVFAFLLLDAEVEAHDVDEHDVVAHGIHELPPLLEEGSCRSRVAVSSCGGLLVEDLLDREHGD